MLKVDEGMDGAILLKREAITALGRLGGPEVVPILRAVSTEGRPEVSHSIAVALGFLGRPEAIPILEEMAKNSDPMVRPVALKALASYCSDSSSEVVERAYDENDAEVRWGAMVWFNWCGSGKHISFLVRGVKDGDVPYGVIRMQALEGLTRLRSSAGCAYVGTAYLEKPETVRDAAGKYAALLCTH